MLVLKLYKTLDSIFKGNCFVVINNFGDFEIHPGLLMHEILSYKLYFQHRVAGRFYIGSFEKLYTISHLRQFYKIKKSST